jgi:hypothetical protein
MDPPLPWAVDADEFGSRRGGRALASMGHELRHTCAVPSLTLFSTFENAEPLIPPPPVVDPVDPVEPHVAAVGGFTTLTTATHAPAVGTAQSETAKTLITIAVMVFFLNIESLLVSD